MVADVLEFNGNLLDVCIGPCRDTTGGGGYGGGDSGVPVVGVPGTLGTLGRLGDSGASGTTVAVAGFGTAGPCCDAVTSSLLTDGKTNMTTNAAMTDVHQNGNPGPGFAMSTADLNLPIHRVELRCPAGGNAQVFNGYAVMDMHGQKIGIARDAVLTDHFKVGRRQFQRPDQRCFGLGTGVYTVKGASLMVDVPAS